MTEVIKKLFPNDIQKIDEKTILKDLDKNTKFSLSFVVLLIGSAVVSTLGLLINSTPVVIGGMIISPLVHPLLKISFGLTFEKKNYTSKALAVLFISIFVVIVGSALIAYISPIKLINEEILARTNPTLLDVIIGIVGGTIAALGLTQSRVSQSLAGVAVATALVPPLSVAGISLALFEWGLFWGSLWLFIGNVVAIVFAAVLTFSLLNKKNDENSPKRRGLVIISIILIITSIPMWYFLLNNSFKTQVYTNSQSILEKTLHEISPSIYLGNIKTNVDNNNIVEIEAELELPENILINYEQQQDIKDELEEVFGKKVDLKLRLTNTISIISEETFKLENTKEAIENALVKRISELNSAFSIKSISSKKEPGNGWVISAVIYTNPGVTMSYQKHGEIEQYLRELTEDSVQLNLEIITLSSLKSEQTEDEKTIASLSQDLEKLFLSLPQGTSSEIDINYINITDFDTNEVLAKIEIKIPYNYEIDPDKIIEIKNNLKEKYNKNITLKINKIYKEEIIF